MKVAFFTIPVLDPTSTQQTVNQFLSQHRVVSVDRQLVTSNDCSVWALCVTYIDAQAIPSTKPTKERVDYKEILTPEEFDVFSSLRELRKTVAAQQGINLYHVFTNDQLAAIVQKRMTTKAQVAGISGVGKARAENFAPIFLEAMKQGFAVNAAAS